MNLRGSVGLLLIVVTGSAAAQQRVDEKRAASHDGTVKISSTAGSIRVVGWDRDTVAITGTLGAEIAHLDFRIDERATRIYVVPNRTVFDAADTDALVLLGSDLEIRVPRRSYVAVRTVSATIDVVDMSGGVDLVSEGGDIRVTAGSQRRGARRIEYWPLSIYAESAGGDIDIDARTKIVRAKSVNGSVTVRRGHGFVEISTVSGDARLSGEGISRGGISTVSGDIWFEGDFERGALSFSFQTHSGSIELRLPSHIAAFFDLSTVSGRIENEFAPASASSFSTGRGGARVKVTSFKGGIRILRSR